MAFVDADELDIPVLDRRRVDLTGRVERVQTRTVADQRAADGDVIEQPATLIHSAITDVAEAEKHILAGVGGYIVVMRLEAVGRTIDSRPQWTSNRLVTRNDGVCGKSFRRHRDIAV